MQIKRHKTCYHESEIEIATHLGCLTYAFSISSILIWMAKIRGVGGA